MFVDPRPVNRNTPGQCLHVVPGHRLTTLGDKVSDDFQTLVKNTSVLI